LVKIEKKVARQAKKLADFYCTIAFAKQRVDVKIVNHELAELWKLLEQTQTTTLSTLQTA
ncbi:MAG: hypothetical protein VX438_06125, partial [Planctomycetota bacterium]|nr:hypothetical protein [Planctomycetota bacterium]